MWQERFMQQVMVSPPRTKELAITDPYSNSEDYDSISFELMMALSTTNAVTLLAHQADSLATRLCSLQQKCQRKQITSEISAITDELSRLSATLKCLDGAIGADPSQYTDVFHDDLSEITAEIRSIFEEISGCCTNLELADTSTSACAWFFRKGRVNRLSQHLDALKGTLMVMRMVLWHGKDYGTHKSDRLAENHPHVMYEDRVILEAVFAQNRDAISELHELMATESKDRNMPAPLADASSREGDHHRKFSEMSGIYTPSIPDVLPLANQTNNVRLEDSKVADSTETVHRSSSKRGVRLGVHMSILDLSAHNAPENLKRKWVQQARDKRACPNRNMLPAPINHFGPLTSPTELSKISEVDTNVDSRSDLGRGAPMAHQPDPIARSLPETSLSTTNMPIVLPVVSSTTLADLASASPVPSNSAKCKLKRVISKMSLTRLRSLRNEPE